jgi:DNA-binding MarR family transcriptional regulator
MSATIEPAEPVTGRVIAAATRRAVVPADERRSAPRAGDWQIAAWRSFLRAHAHVMRRLEQDLQANHKVSLATYDVLVQLVEAPEHRLRMSELADAVLLSRSGLTRLVDRMQREGLVERQPDPYDARGLFTVLTAAGLAALKDAAVVHLAGVDELVLSRLTEGELRGMYELMSKIDPLVPEAQLPPDACGIE